MEKQTPNNSEYIEHHPEAIQDKDLAHEVAHDGHTERSLAASARRAVALLNNRVSDEERAAKPEVYKEAEELVRELTEALSTNGIDEGYGHGEGPKYDWREGQEVPQFDDLDSDDRTAVADHLNLNGGRDRYHDRVAGEKEAGALTRATQPRRRGLFGRRKP